MPTTHFDIFLSWFLAFEANVPAILATTAIGLFLICAIGAISSPRRERDEFFHRQVV